MLLTCIKRKMILKTNFWSFREWPFYTDFTVGEHFDIGYGTAQDILTKLLRTLIWGPALSMKIILARVTYTMPDIEMSSCG